MPPAWISKPSPKYFILIAEHSICHPGRPSPHGDGHDGSLSPPATLCQPASLREALLAGVALRAGFFAFHKTKSSALPFLYSSESVPPESDSPLARCAFPRPVSRPYFLNLETSK